MSVDAAYMGRPALTVCLIAFALCVGCGQRPIPNTDVPDTVMNRDIIKFMETYRRAVEKRDAPALISMASKQYYDDNGTPGGSDDVDFRTLKEVLKAWVARVRDVRYEIRYRAISSTGDRLFVEFTYSGSFLVDLKDGETWRRRIGDHRVTLVRDSEHPSGYRIISGM